MILSEVRTTIRDYISGLGYDEWKGYLSDNVPNSIVEHTFHVSVNGGVGAPLNMHVLKIENDVVVTLWKKGFRDSVEAQDAGLASVQEVLCTLLNPVARTTPAFRRIDLNGYELETISTDNDSVCKITINLTVEVILEVTQTVQV